jgi:hypothetical protein
MDAQNAVDGINLREKETGWESPFIGVKYV